MCCFLHLFINAGFNEYMEKIVASEEAYEKSCWLKESPKSCLFLEQRDPRYKY